MTGNNDGDRRVPGTWLVTITGPVSTRAIVTFTRDGGMAERIQGTPEALLGAWEPIPGPQRRFRFTGLRYRHNLTDPNTPFQRTTRVRGTCQTAANNDAFNGTVTVDSLDSSGNVEAGSSVVHLQLAGARMPVVPE